MKKTRKRCWGLVMPTGKRTGWAFILKPDRKTGTLEQFIWDKDFETQKILKRYKIVEV